jgi:hypothetical protein
MNTPTDDRPPACEICYYRTPDLCYLDDAGMFLCPDCYGEALHEYADASAVDYIFD